MSIVRERIPEASWAPKRLGRHVRHDPRSARFAIAGAPVSTLASKRWTRRIPVLDQGQLGSCTGNAAAGWLGTDDATRQGITRVGDSTVDESYAVSLYSVATNLDSEPGSYPPDDTGSDGLSVAKALQTVGLCTGYQHAFSLQAALTALQTGPVMFGTVWLDAMFEPMKTGQLSLQGSVAGGHEYLVDEIDVVNRRIWLTNSWAESWGIGGRAWLAWADADTLLAQQGDVTVPTPVTAPVPVPTPTPVPPAPGAPTDADLWATAKAWAAGAGLA